MSEFIQPPAEIIIGGSTLNKIREQILAISGGIFDANPVAELAFGAIITPGPGNSGSLQHHGISLHEDVLYSHPSNDPKYHFNIFLVCEELDHHAVVAEY